MRYQNARSIVHIIPHLLAQILLIIFKIYLFFVEVLQWKRIEIRKVDNFYHQCRTLVSVAYKEINRKFLFKFLDKLYHDSKIKDMLNGAISEKEKAM